MFDPLLVNPAYAGSQVQLSATGIYRNQWVNFPGAPKTFTATAHSGFRKARVGVGLIAAHDEIGIHNENALYGVYSYKIPLNRFDKSSVISFGIQGGFNNLRSNYNLLNEKQPDKYGVLSDLIWNFGAGIYYRSKKMWAGFSVPQILNNEILTAETAFSSLASQYRYYYLMGGSTFEVAPKVKIIPSTLIRIQEKAPVSFDINTMIVLSDVVGLGASYRLNDSVIGLFELQLNENFHVGYAYDVTTSDIRLYSNGTHEIMINYRIKIAKIHTGLECPSYW
jgi:type IX secretion system PorP/SprF family membrane protein